MMLKGLSLTSYSDAHLHLHYISEEDTHTQKTPSEMAGDAWFHFEHELWVKALG